MVVLIFCSIRNVEMVVNPLVGLSAHHLVRTHRLQLTGTVCVSVVQANQNQLSSLEL